MGAWLQSTFPAMPSGTSIAIMPMTSFELSEVDAIFPSVSAPPTYAALSALPCASEGWQRIFDAWKAQGLIT